MKTKSSIKLFVDAHVFDKEFQGTQTFIREIYTVLLERYPDLEIYFGASDIENIKNKFPLAKAENIIKYKSSGIGFMRYLTDIPAIIKKNKINFAHFQYISPQPIKNCFYIVTLHDILFNDFTDSFPWRYRVIRNFLFKKSIREAAIKTTVSAYSAERIAHYYKIDNNELHVLHNGVSKSFGSRFNTKEEAVFFIKNKYGIQNFILYTSRIEPRKNHLMALSAFLDLKLYKKNIHLVFIGKKSIETVGLRKKIEQLDKTVTPFFHWLLQVEQYDLEAFYRGCKLFVFPSKAEGFGIPPLEAAQCKVPVLCSNATAMKEFTFFEPYRFEPDNENAFRRKFEEMICKPPDELFLENVSDEVLQKYSWEKTASILVNLMKTHFASNQK